MCVSKIETNPEDFTAYVELHNLLRHAFAYMEGRIDPPSSLTRMTESDVAAKADAEDLFLIREDGVPLACLFGTSRGSVYYVGKLAVATDLQRQGIARALMDVAAAHARATGHTELQLESRIELVENHAAFTAMGFTQCGATAHEGYNQPTSLTFRRPL